MTRWQPTGEVHSRRATQIAVQLFDEYRGAPPAGSARVTLQVLEGAEWVETEIAPAVTSTGVYTWPGLERRVAPTGLPARKYRVLASAAGCLPLYPSASSPGVPFDVQPYNDDHPPAAWLASPTPLYLLPAPTYAFPTHIRVLRGRVLDQATGAPVEGAIVSEGVRERVLTDENGSWALPLRWPARNAAGLNIDADGRDGRIGSIPVNLPADLGQGHDIAIN